MSQILKKIAKNTRYYRLKKKLTQKELAKKAKIHPSYISRVENAKINLFLTTLYAIAKALDIHAVDLVK
jgi:transcriptional regulator with XRE-family HTH domain